MTAVTEPPESEAPQWRHAAERAAWRAAAERAAKDLDYYQRCPRGLRMLADHIRLGGEA